MTVSAPWLLPRHVDHCCLSAVSGRRDLLHGQMDIEVVKTVAQPGLQGPLGVGGNESGVALILLIEIFDDDAGLRDGAIRGVVAQYRKLADRPQLQQRGAFGLVGEIDRNRRERRLVFVESDQRLPAERRQGMEVKLERHDAVLWLVS